MTESDHVGKVPATIIGITQGEVIEMGGHGQTEFLGTKDERTDMVEHIVTCCLLIGSCYHFRLMVSIFLIEKIF